MKIKKKGEAGAATAFLSRKKALRKLQLSLQDFRRLCILKGVYPHEPSHKKKVNKGSSENRVFYYARDILFLAQEPIINKFRQNKIFLRKLKHAKARREQDKIVNLHENREEYDLDRIVKERYPNFTSALRDLDDALCLCFIFSRMTRKGVLKPHLIDACRRLTAEFTHYVIESRSLLHSFISIKGIYFQAEIMGEKITWIVAHDRGLPPSSEVDMDVLATFAEFYVTMLGFVNYRLYQLQGLYYPPQIESGTREGEDPDEEREKVYSLARPLIRRQEREEEDMDTFDDEGNLEQRIIESKKLKSLFSGCVFWVNRECPREALAILIRSCGGTVGWEGAPVSLKEDDPTITHHVIDRPLTNMNLARIYVQPQWVWDSVNARRHLSCGDYAPGATLPPHLSPFTSEKPGDYVPLERIEELRNQGKDVSGLVSVGSVEQEIPKPKKPKVEKKPVEGLAVERGQMHKINQQKIINMQGEALKMREMMLPRKKQRLYNMVKKGLKRNRAEGTALVRKRANIEKKKQEKA